MHAVLHESKGLIVVARTVVVLGGGGGEVRILKLMLFNFILRVLGVGRGERLIVLEGVGLEVWIVGQREGRQTRNRHRVVRVLRVDAHGREGGGVCSTPRRL